jgi:adenine-specific DNA glycosylase
MDKVKCELCPIQDYCVAYKKQKKENDLSYHHQELVRVYVEKCPLIKHLS